MAFARVWYVSKAGTHSDIAVGLAQLVHDLPCEVWVVHGHAQDCLHNAVAELRSWLHTQDVLIGPPAQPHSMDHTMFEPLHSCSYAAVVHHHNKQQDVMGSCTRLAAAADTLSQIATACASHVTASVDVACCGFAASLRLTGCSTLQRCWHLGASSPCDELITSVQQVTNICMQQHSGRVCKKTQGQSATAATHCCWCHLAR